MASKKQIWARGTNGVLWWRFWNPMVKFGDWRYMEGFHNIACTDEQQAELFDEPIGKLWTQDHNADGVLIREHCKKEYETEIITDIDDWYDDIPEFNNAKAVHRRYGLTEQVKEMHKTADSICCSTPFLVDKMGPKAHYAPNFVIPESWDHPKRIKRDPDECLLMFAGGTGRAHEIHLLQDAFRAFLDEPNTKLLLIGAFHEFAAEYPPGKVVWGRFCEPWDYPALLQWADPDIAVSPLYQCDFNVAKSNIKWLESAMIDACFVGERWGELDRTIEDGVTGHLCDGIDEWTEKLVSLARDKKVRDRTSKAAKSVVLSDWTWGAVEKHWRAALGV